MHIYIYMQYICTMYNTHIVYGLHMYIHIYVYIYIYIYTYMPPCPLVQVLLIVGRHRFHEHAVGGQGCARRAGSNLEHPEIENAGGRR